MEPRITTDGLKRLFGDPEGDHATVDLRDLCVHIWINGRDKYYIDLERCLTGAELCDWIFQVAGKTWMTPEVIGLVVQALDAALYPQSCLCSTGRNLRMRKHEIGRHVARRLAAGFPRNGM